MSLMVINGHLWSLHPPSTVLQRSILGYAPRPVANLDNAKPLMVVASPLCERSFFVQCATGSRILTGTGADLDHFGRNRIASLKKLTGFDRILTDFFNF